MKIIRVKKNDPPPKGQWVHGYVSSGSFDLTQDEARKLANDLITAADVCKHIEYAYADYVYHSERNHEGDVQ